MPKVTHTVAAKFSPAAREKKVGGHVIVKVLIGTDGLPEKVTVVRGVGYGLDESAVEAVKQYRFRPALKDGVAITCEINIEVVFKIDGNEGEPI